jgi:FkbM family methyltransferase
MNIFRSIRAFGEVCREDADFRALGRPFGWSVCFHYLGRWYDRRGTSMSVRNIAFSHRGQRVKFAMTDKYMGAFKGIFNDKEYDCAAMLARAPRRILDLGANIGFGSVFFSKAFPEAEIVVVEPDPRNLPLLRKNLGLNGISSTVIEGAIGSAAGTLALRFGTNPTCSSLAGTGMHDLSNTVEVAVTTVPKVMKQAGWDSIDLLKIDIEGAEEDLLAHDNQWLAKVGAIIMEIHPNTTVERINGHLAAFGFVLKRLGSGREPVYFAQKKIT